MTHPIYHTNGRRDKRYRVGMEYTGHREGPQYVARFCDTWLGQAPTMAAATVICLKHNAARGV